MFQLSHRLERPTEMPKRVLKIWQHKETAGTSVLTLIKTTSPKPPLHSLKQQLAPELINLRSVFFFRAQKFDLIISLKRAWLYAM